MRLIFSFIVITVVSLSAVTAQDDYDPEKQFYDAEFHLIYDRCEEALPLFLSLADAGIDHANLHYKIGYSFLHIPGEKQKAIPHLEKAIISASWESKSGEYTEKKAPGESRLLLGMAYHANNELNKALVQFTLFQEEALEAQKKYKNKPLLQNEIKDYLLQTDKEIRSCELALKMQESPVDLDIRNAGNLNIGTSNFLPSLSGDGSTMVFASEREHYYAVFLSDLKNGVWEKPRNITMELESDGDFLPSSLSYNGKKLFLIHWENSHFDLFESSYFNGRWMPVSPLTLNTFEDEIHACLSQDGKTLYFVSNRNGGLGGLDIYESTLDDEGEWGAPTNLGEPVNTPYHEHTPFLSVDGQILFFSSTGHPGMGGYDIFYCRKNEDDTWSEPQNIGYPVNTTDDDIHFTPGSSPGIDPLRLGFMSRYDASGQTIYEYEFYSDEYPRKAMISGKVGLIGVPDLLDKNVQVSLINMPREDTLISHTIKHSDGEYSLRTAPGDYLLVFEKKGFQKVSDTLTILPENLTAPVEMNALLIAEIEPPPSEMVKEEKIDTIRPVFFAFDDCSFSKTATRELSHLIQILHQNTTIHLILTGHTDSFGSESYNMSLSKKRALAVIDYLTKRGIAAERLTPLWKGELQPVAKNSFPDGTDNPEGRKLNRRVSFDIEDPKPENITILEK